MPVHFSQRASRPRVLIGALLCFLTLLGPAAVLAGDVEAKPEPVQLTGFITDEWCGKANANPQGAKCARSCAKKGSDLAIYASGKLYKLDDKPRALEFLGFEVQVTGTLNSDGIVQVASIKKSKPKKSNK